MQQEECNVQLKTHCAVILGSLAKGMDTNLTHLIDSGIMNALFMGIHQQDLK